ncbi:MAG: FtsX-like permease family protein, partial [Thermoanaerobaculia bacterium]
MAINETLRRELDAELGDTLLLAFERAATIPGESLLGERDPGQRLETLRLTLAAVLPDRGAGRFSLAASQALPLNAFVPLPELQRRLDRHEGVNLLLITGSAGVEPSQEAGAGVEILDSALRRSLDLEDIGLRLEPGEGYLTLESDELVLRPEVVRAIRATAQEQGATAQPILTYLANTISVGDRTLPYSTVAALELPPPPVSGALRISSGQMPSPKGSEDILLNRWAAEELGAKPGDRVEMAYFVVGDGDELRVERHRFLLAGVVELEGLGADADLTPEVPGIADAEDMSAWDPPFPLDLDLIRPRDEEYWDRYRGAPKALVPLAIGQRLWRSRFGELTSIRLAAPAGLEASDFEASLRSRLFQEGSLEALGFRLEPLKQRGLAAASGTTDFSGLFVGFSLFLIVSACLLVGLLFGLLVESRAQEMGTRRAVGFPLKKVRLLLLTEGGLLAVVGALAGLGLAVLYGRGVLAGLRSWWAPLVDSPFLRFHAAPVSLALGFGISVVLVLLSVVASVRRLGKTPVRALLAGSLAAGRPPQRRRWARAVALGSTLVALALLALAMVGGRSASPALFFGLGSALCVAGLAGFALWLGRPQAHLAAEGRRDLLRMAARNGAASPGRSLLCVALVASACFVLVSVAANRRDFADAPLSRESGAGGFALVAESDVALPRGLDRPQELAELGFQEEQIAALAGATTYALRLLPGEDASCLNLYQPERPRLLGVPPALVQRGGFSFSEVLGEPSNPWTLLEQPLEPGVIPAIGDDNSVRWILHLALG